jgi:hypothetical protein
MAPRGTLTARQGRVRAARCLLGVVLGAAAVSVAWPVATAAAAATKVTAKGTAAGDLAPGSTIQVKLQVNDSEGWQRLDTIEVSLRLRDQPLDRVQVVPSAFSISVVNSGAPASIGEPGLLRGPYFRLDNAEVTVSAKAGEYDLTFPLRLAADPPPGAQLVLVATDSTGVASRDVALTPPVTNKDKGFPWGTIGLAVAGALFIGAFVGNTFSTRRSRGRPNIYATVARRLDEERAKK